MINDDKFNKLVDQALMEFARDGESSKEELHSGGFTKDELSAFLAEIEAEDEDLAKEEIISISALEEDKLDDENNDVVNDLINDPNGWFNKSKWVATEEGEFVRKSDGELFSIGEDIVTSVEDSTQISDKTERATKIQNATTRWKHNRDLHKIEINRMAFDQKILPLSERLTIEHKRLVIELLTRPIRNLIIKYENYINNRIAKLLLPAIPGALKLAQLKWPWVFVQNPGFMYKTHERMGPVMTFWATPKIPYFFPQGTEQTILEERDASLTPYFLDCIDRAVIRWYKAKENLVKREVSYAAKMINIKGNTYYHLLLLNPFWFEKLYNEIKSKQA